MKTFKMALVVAVTGVALSFSGQAKATANDHHNPTWKEAGCDNLAELNKEWLELSSDWGVDFYLRQLANQQIAFQNNWERYGKPTDRLYYNEYGCNNLLDWKIKTTTETVKVKKFVWQYTLCNDGWHSSSTGRGTCSWHGGMHSYRGYHKTLGNKTVVKKRIHFYWVH